MSGGPAGSQGLKKSSIFRSARLSSVSLSVVGRCEPSYWFSRSEHPTTLPLEHSTATRSSSEQFGHSKQLKFHNLYNFPHIVKKVDFVNVSKHHGTKS